MGWFVRTFQSSVGGKYVVAITGLMLVLFLVAHLSGNLLIFAGAEALAQYAEGLRKFPALLWILRLGLIAAALLHVVFAVRVNRANAAARPVPYAKKTFIKATLASRSMVLTGLLILGFAAFHLAHYTLRITDPAIGGLGPYEVYRMMVTGFSSPVVSGFYILCMVVLGMHLSHGISSLFQTLGLNHPKYNCLIRTAGPAAGAMLALGFISIPVAVLLGVVQ